MSSKLLGSIRIAATRNSSSSSLEIRSGFENPERNTFFLLFFTFSALEILKQTKSSRDPTGSKREQDLTGSHSEIGK